jgi:outer membrane protein
MKKILSTLAVATALTTSASAGAIVDLTVGGGSMVSDTPTAKFGDSEITAVTMNMADDAQTYAWAQFDHAIPIVPNLRIEMNSLSYSGTANLTGTFNGVSITTGTAGSVDFTNQDYIAYWGVPFSTWIPMIDEADFGIGAKIFEGSLKITGAADEALSFPIPYGYAKLHVSPPFLFGLGFEAEVKMLSGDGFTFNESIFKADWLIEAPIPVIDLSIGLEAGYRSTVINYAADGSAAFLDFEFSGIFFGAVASFGI